MRRPWWSLVVLADLLARGGEGALWTFQEDHIQRPTIGHRVPMSQFLSQFLESLDEPSRRRLYDVVELTERDGANMLPNNTCECPFPASDCPTATIYNNSMLYVPEDDAEPMFILQRQPTLLDVATAGLEACQEIDGLELCQANTQCSPDPNYIIYDCEKLTETLLGVAAYRADELARFDDAEILDLLLEFTNGTVTGNDDAFGNFSSHAILIYTLLELTGYYSCTDGCNLYYECAALCSDTARANLQGTAVATIAASENCTGTVPFLTPTNSPVSVSLPTAKPVAEPTSDPTGIPSQAPVISPTSEPSIKPSVLGTSTLAPIPAPTMTPVETEAPSPALTTLSPTSAPEPSSTPTALPPPTSSPIVELFPSVSPTALFATTPTLTLDRGNGSNKKSNGLDAAVLAVIIVVVVIVFVFLVGMCWFCAKRRQSEAAEPDAAGKREEEPAPEVLLEAGQQEEPEKDVLYVDTSAAAKGGDSSIVTASSDYAPASVKIDEAEL